MKSFFYAVHNIAFIVIKGSAKTGDRHDMNYLFFRLVGLGSIKTPQELFICLNQNVLKLGVTWWCGLGFPSISCHPRLMHHLQ